MAYPARRSLRQAANNERRRRRTERVRAHGQRNERDELAAASSTAAIDTCVRSSMSDRSVAVHEHEDYRGRTCLISSGLEMSVAHLGESPSSEEGQAACSRVNQRAIPAHYATATMQHGGEELQDQQRGARRASSPRISHKPISERRKSRSFATTNQNCQVMNRYSIYVILLVQLAAQLSSRSTGARATSFVQSVWLPAADNAQQDQLKPAPSNQRQSVAAVVAAASNRQATLQQKETSRKMDFEPTRAGSQQRPPSQEKHSNKTRVASAKQGLDDRPTQLAQLTSSASSLRPSVVVAEPGDVERAGQQGRPVAQRRSSQPFASEPQFRLAHVEPNPPDEHLWNGTQQRGQPNQTSNAQVHFDEDQQQQHHEQHSNRRQLIPKPLVDFETVRRHDNETILSNLAPQHADFQPDEVRFDDPPNRSQNRSKMGVNDTSPPPPPPPQTTIADEYLDGDSPVLAGRNQKAASSSSSESAPKNQRAPEPAPTFYYLPDGDKWNSDNDNHRLTTASDMTNSPRSSPGRSPDEQRPPDDADYHTNFTGRPDPSTAYRLNGAHHELRPVSKPVTAIERSPGQPAPSEVNFGFAPDSVHEALHAYYPGGAKSYSLTGVQRPSPLFAHNHQFQSDASLAAPLPYSQAPLPLPSPPMPSAARTGTSRPQSLHHILSSSHYEPPGPPPLKRFRPDNSRAESHRINLGDGPNRVAAPVQKSFVRNQNLGQFVGAKPRKSFLSTINEKFNQWTGEPALGSAGRDEMRLLESAFFDPQPSHRPAGFVTPILRPNRAFRPQSKFQNALRPPLNPYAFYNTVRQPTVAPAASSLGRFHGYTRGLASKQRRPQSGGLTGLRGVQQQGSQQPASFIPVVAVQVTRTSPAPTPLSQTKTATHNQLDPFGQARAQHAQSSANEIEQYLASKMGRSSGGGSHQLNANERQKWDEAFSPAGQQQVAGISGVTALGQSAASDRNQAQKLASAGLQQPQHETTVKGAVFGFMPHQADAPLMHAMSVLQQLPPVQSSTQDSPRGANQIDAYPTTDRDAYANQMDKSSQAVDAATSLFDYQALAATGQSLAPVAQISAERPSLALQLQANNFAQNDIAHPFGEAASIAQPAAPAPTSVRLDQRLALPKNRPLELIQPNQAQYGGYQYLSAAQLGAYQDQLGQLIASPLAAPSISASGQSQPLVEQYQPFVQPASSPASSQLLAAMAAGNELNPLLAGSQFAFQNAPQFQPLDAFFETGAKLGNRPAAEDDPIGIDQTESTDSTSVDSTQQQQQSQQQAQQQQAAPTEAPTTTETGHRNQALNNKGRKRSSEFFANAGQLLLSALPLLLAPTLGLMFAASPSIPAARYHGLGQLPQAGSQTGGLFGAVSKPPLGHHESAHHDEGMVMNASPAPQMFTPTPPGSHNAHSNSAAPTPTDRPLRELDAGGHSSHGGEAATQAQPPTATTTSTSTTPRPRGLFKSSASLPALTGLKLTTPDSNASRVSGRNGQSTSRPFAVLLTTLEPALSLSAGANRSSGSANYDVDEIMTGANNKSQSLDEPLELINSSGEATIVTPTLLLVEAQTEDPPEENEQQPQQGRRNASLVESAVISEGAFQVQHEQRAPNLATTKSPQSSTAAYDTGYQGADFDAQFPALRRTNQRKPIIGMNATLNKFVKNKSQYQYADAPTDSTAGNFELASLVSDSRANFNANNASRHDSGAHSEIEALESGRHELTVTQPPAGLYPVATWPPLRRRTVSLITSRGNTTVPKEPERHRYFGWAGLRSDAATANRRRSKLDAGRVGSEAGRIVQATSDKFIVHEAGKFSNHRRRKRDTTEAIGFDNKIPNAAAELNQNTKLRKSQKLKHKSKKGSARRPVEQSQIVGDKFVNETVANQSNLAVQPPVKQLLNSSSPLEIIDRESAEQLTRDSSKRKSAIVTAMITQVGSGEGDQDEPGSDAARTAAESDPDEEAQLAHEELRAQLVAKKILLDRLATRAASSSELGEQAPSDDVDNFRLGGRGNFKPAQVPDSVMDTPNRNYSATRFVSGRSRLKPAERTRANSIELNEKTKQALAKFGSLLLEDTLQIPGARNETGPVRQRPLLGRPKYSVDHHSRSSHSIAHDQQEGSATERYPVRSATRTPPAGELAHDNWSSLHADRNQTSQAGRAYEQAARPDQAFVYQYPQSRARTRHPGYDQPEASNTSDWESRYEPARRYKPAGEVHPASLNGHAYPVAGGPPMPDEFAAGLKPTAGRHAVGPEFATDRYSNFLPEYKRANRTSNGTESEPHLTGNSNGDQLDARHSTYSNYSTTPPSHYGDPHYYQPGSSYDRYGPASRRQEPPSAIPPAGYYAEDQPPPPPPPPASYHHHSHYERQPQHYYSGSQNSAYGLPTYPQSHRQSSNYPPAGYLSNHRHGPPEDHYQSYSPPLTPSSLPPAPPPFRSPEPRNQGPPMVPTRHPAAHPATYDTPNNYYSAAYNSESHLHQPQRHLPVSSTYAPSSSSLAPHQAYDAYSAGPGSRSQPRQTSQMQPGSRTAADSSRAINDYLKRAQFSDSDRDKLMASYLTCDGLLHDNDHCLERLSCEFSDPKNIEKANKLDRAVSSILLGHILINTYIPNSFKLRLKSASLFGYTQSGKCSKFACNKLAKQASASEPTGPSATDDEPPAHNDVERR